MRSDVYRNVEKSQESSIPLSAPCKFLFSYYHTSMQTAHNVAYSSVSLRPEMSDLRIRCATPGDIDQLCSLNREAWPPPLQGLPRIDLEWRIHSFPAGQLVLVDSSNTIIGSLFTQRIASIDALRGKSFDNVSRLHAADGPVWLLVSVQVRPSHLALGLGDRLVHQALAIAMSEGVPEAVAVTRCRVWAATGVGDSSLTILRHAKECQDPGIGFHTGRGAAVIDVLPGWRRDDERNRNTGVLVHYDLRRSTSRPPDGDSSTSLLMKMEALVCRLIDAEELSADAPLIDSGLDSYLLPAIAEEIGALVGVALPSTFALDFGTLRGMAEHFTRGLSPQRQVLLSRRCNATLICCIGSACRWPSALSFRRHHLATCADAIKQVPSHRWSATSVHNDDLDDVVRHGAFVAGVELFDNRVFGIGSEEAMLVDPQQRLLLEEGYAALVSYGLRRAALRGNATGVFIGITENDWKLGLHDRGLCGMFAGTGTNLAVASGRISFVLGLQGPCMSIDTACSSTLVSLHTASQELHVGECDAALVAAVNLLLLPTTSLALFRAGFLAADGRCKTWDVRANGYVRGEVAGGCVFTRRREGDIAVVASTVRQDGKSTSLTAPNGSAQVSLLASAAKRGGIVHLATVEAHGTGTALGDPTEVGALAQTWHGSSVGGVKANLGNLEPAAGMAGLVKAVEGLLRRILVGNAQLRLLNPLVGAHASGSASPLGLTAQTARLTGDLLGVSSFGFSGTISHVVLRVSADGAAPDVSASMSVRFHHRRFSFISRGSKNAALYQTGWAPMSSASSDARGPQLWLFCSSGAVRLRERAATWGPMSPHVLASSVNLMPPLRAVALVLQVVQAAAPAADDIAVVFRVAQQLSRLSTPPRLLLLTRGAQVLKPAAAAAACAHSGGWWGLARVLRLEAPSLRVMSVDMAVGPHAISEELTVARLDLAGEAETAWAGSVWHGPRLRWGRALVAMGADWRDRGGAWLISGGLGGLGLRGASLLSERGAARVVLASRSGRVAHDRQGLEARLRGLASGGATTWVVAVDGAEAAEASAAMRAMMAGQLSGVLHTAGVLADRLVHRMEAMRVASVLSPKGVGAAHLHCAAARSALGSMVLFSSVAASFGNVGQANYAAANACLDSRGLSRRLRGETACSVQLPLVSGAGMGQLTADAGLVAAAPWSMGLEEYAACLRELLGGGAAVVTPLPFGTAQMGSVAAGVAARPLLAELSTCASLASEPLTSPTNALAQAVAMLPAPQRQTHVEALVLRVVRELTDGDSGAIDADMSLLEAGVNSLAATELSHRLREETGLPLSSTLAFEYATPRAIVRHVAEQLADTTPVVAAPAAPPDGLAVDSPVSPLQAISRPQTCMRRAAVGPVRRILMLHGAAADAELQLMLLEAMGWSPRGAPLQLCGGRCSIEFVCVDAPAPSPPKPELFHGLHELGLYAKAEYRCWRLNGALGGAGTSAADVDAAVEHVCRLMQANAPIHGVGGFCDGALVAALVVARGTLDDTLRPGVSLPRCYLNLCGAPPSRFVPYDAFRVGRGVRSLHVLGLADEMYTQSELLELPGRCDGAEIHYHLGHHGVPPMSGELRAALTALVGFSDVAAVTEAHEVDVEWETDGEAGGKEAQTHAEAVPDSLSLVLSAAGGDRNDYHAAAHGYALGMLTVVLQHTLWDVTPRTRSYLPIVTSRLGAGLFVALAGASDWCFVRGWRGVARKLVANATALLVCWAAAHAFARVSVQAPVERWAPLGHGSVGIGGGVGGGGGGQSLFSYLWLLEMLLSYRMLVLPVWQLGRTLSAQRSHWSVARLALPMVAGALALGSQAAYEACFDPRARGVVTCHVPWRAPLLSTWLVRLGVLLPLSPFFHHRWHELLPLYTLLPPLLLTCRCWWHRRGAMTRGSSAEEASAAATSSTEPVSQNKWRIAAASARLWRACAALVLCAVMSFDAVGTSGRPPLAIGHALASPWPSGWERRAVARWDLLLNACVYASLAALLPQRPTAASRLGEASLVCLVIHPAVLRLVVQPLQLCASLRLATMGAAAIDEGAPSGVVLISETSALLTALAVLVASSLSLRRAPLRTSNRLPAFRLVAPAGLAPLLAAWLFLFAAPALCRAVSHGPHRSDAASGAACIDVARELAAAKQQLDAAAVREARGVDLIAAQTAVADSLREEMEAMQRHQEATEVQLRVLMAALKRRREESAAAPGSSHQSTPSLPKAEL